MCTSLDNYGVYSFNASVRSGDAWVANKKLNKITVLLELAESDRFEAYCTERGFKKSTLIARLIREYLDKEAFRLDRHHPGSGTGRRR